MFDEGDGPYEDRGKWTNLRDRESSGLFERDRYDLGVLSRTPGPVERKDREKCQC